MLDVNVSEDGKVVDLIDSDNNNKISVSSAKLLYIGIYTSLFKKEIDKDIYISCDKQKDVHIVNGEVELKVHITSYIRLINGLERKVSLIRRNEEPPSEELSCVEFLSNYYNKDFNTIIISKEGNIFYNTPKVLKQLISEYGSVSDIIENGGYILMERNEIIGLPNHKITEQQDKTIREIKMRGIFN